METEGTAVHQDLARQLLDRCETLPDPDADEPTALDAVRDERPKGPRTLDIDNWDMHDALKGALVGRCAGCRLGKPVESWTRQEIDRFLSATDRSSDRYLRADIPGTEGFDTDATGGWNDRFEGPIISSANVFADAAAMAETGLRPPVAMEVGDALGVTGCLTVEGLLSRLIG